MWGRGTGTSSDVFGRTVRDRVPGPAAQLMPALTTSRSGVYENPGTGVRTAPERVYENYRDPQHYAAQLPGPLLHPHCACAQALCRHSGTAPARRGLLGAPIGPARGAGAYPAVGAGSMAEAGGRARCSGGPALPEPSRTKYIAEGSTPDGGEPSDLATDGLTDTCVRTDRRVTW